MSTTKWVIDAAHSEIRFKVKHLMVTNVTGEFSNFSGSVNAKSRDFSDANIHFTADINSVTTGNEQRDQHLKGPDFFDAEKFPQLSFDSTSLRHKDEDEYELKGNLTIKNVTKSITLKAHFGGIAVDPWGNTKAGFTLEGKLNRKEFGLEWQVITEAGGLLVGEEVKLMIEVQLLQEVPAEAATV
jgi:polyisoprenoid-binding protein YceI